jgi:hypothetical protein
LRFYSTFRQFDGVAEYLCQLVELLGGLAERFCQLAEFPGGLAEEFRQPYSRHLRGGH